MGAVSAAHVEARGLVAALKVLSPELAREPGFLPRFDREIEALSQLNHPNIVRFYEAGQQDGTSYYAMEYVEGEDFEQQLLARGKLPWHEVLDAALQVCPALKHAHDRGIIHRDLKPPNLLRTPAGIVKLTDFGIAKIFAGRQLTSTGGVVGTADYLSPEQAAGKQATKRSDLYSLGVVLYTLLTGRTPFSGDTSAELLHKHLYAQFDAPIKIVPEIPHGLDAIVCQLLEKDPDKRPPDALVLHRELDRLRRRLERKARATELDRPTGQTLTDNGAPGEPVSNPGPATLVSRWMRAELRQQHEGNAFSRWLNKPWVLVTLFTLCVGIIVWRLWLNPVRTDNDVARAPAASETERFYKRGLRLRQEGDGEAARRMWQSLVDAYGAVPEEKHWVGLAREGLDQLTASSAHRQRPESFDLALKKAGDYESEGKKDEAAKIRLGLRELYRDDPARLKQIDSKQR
jgi:serine/threonine-protein kinase